MSFLPGLAACSDQVICRRGARPRLACLQGRLHLNWLGAENVMSTGLSCRYEARLQDVDEMLARPYTALAKLLNCHRDEVAIVSSATSAWTQVKSLATRQGPWQPGRGF